MNVTSIRAECALNNRAFAIGTSGARNVFFEIHPDKTKTVYGNLAGDRRPQIVPSETELLILSGGLGYVFQLATSTLVPITDPDFPTGATKGGYLNGFFLVLEPNSQVFAFSGINNGLAWNGLDFGDVEGAPGFIVTLIIDHLQIWFMGNSHAEAFSNVADALNPFQRIQSGFMEQGAAGVDAICNADNTIFWLSQNGEGQGIVWRANGYTPQRVSTFAIEDIIAEWGDLSQVSMYCYQAKGHTYVRLDCPNANGGNGATVVYDVSSDYWHERGFWDATINDFRADLARTHMFVWGKHLVGDYRSDSIYEQSETYHSDAGAAIRRIRSSPDLANSGSWTVYKLFQLMIETGVARDGAPVQPDDIPEGGAPAGDGTDPQMVLQVSNDGGKTWGNERKVSMGLIGEYNKLLEWRRCGRSRNRAFRVICSEPVYAALVACDIEGRGGS